MLEINKNSQNRMRSVRCSPSSIFTLRKISKNTCGQIKIHVFGFSKNHLINPLDKMRSIKYLKKLKQVIIFPTVLRVLFVFNGRSHVDS